MKQITITTAKATIIVCRLPENAYAIQVLNPMDHKPIIGWTDKVTLTPEYYGLPEGSWQLLGKASELTEEQWESIIEEVNIDGAYFYNLPDNKLTHLATESGSSLLSANGVLLSNPLGENRPVQILDSGSGQIKSSVTISEWQAAEEKVWRNPYVLIKR